MELGAGLFVGGTLGPRVSVSLRSFRSGRRSYLSHDLDIHSSSFCSWSHQIDDLGHVALDHIDVYLMSFSSR